MWAKHVLPLNCREHSEKQFRGKNIWTRFGLLLKRAQKRFTKAQAGLIGWNLFLIHSKYTLKKHKLAEHFFSSGLEIVFVHYEKIVSAE